MPSAVLPKIHPSICTSFRRVVAGKGGDSCNYSTTLRFRQAKLLPGNSRLLQLLPDTAKFTLRKSSSRGYTMVASGSNAVFGDVYIDDKVTSTGNSFVSRKHTGVYFADQSRISCLRASMSLKIQESSSFHLPFGLSSRSLHSSPLACLSAGTAHDVSFDGSSKEDQVANSSDQATLVKPSLKLISGSNYLPHPAKEATGGEDAHFICVDEQAIGVADGVGGWAEVGIDSGLFSRELMSNAVTAIRDEPKGSIDPARVLEKAHSGTKAKGSSTACIISISNEEINAINLGDSGFLVIRDGSTVFNSPVQQHSFNFTYQLESGDTGDLPSSGQVFKIHASPGDVIVAGTDGLFDNVYNNEVSAVVVQSVRAGLGPQQTAEKIAALARKRALDRNRQTPFASAAQEAGFRYHGGKLDDITVVVSYITENTKM